MPSGFAPTHHFFAMCSSDCHSAREAVRSLVGVTSSSSLVFFLFESVRTFLPEEASILRGMKLIPTPTRSAPAVGRPHVGAAWADGAAAAVLACLCGSLLSASPCPAFAATAVAAEPAALSQTAGGPVATETWALLDKYFLDQTFNGLNWPAERQRLRSLEPMTDERAFDEAERLVGRLGDKYSRILGPTAAAKLNKFDVTGVGLNLVISDTGEMKVGSVPAPGTPAASVGIGFGDIVLSLNSRDTKGMTSFDALEAIQGVEGSKLVEVTIAKSAGAEPRKLVMTKTFEEKAPLGLGLGLGLGLWLRLGQARDDQDPRGEGTRDDPNPNRDPNRDPNPDPNPDPDPDPDPNPSPSPNPNPDPSPGPSPSPSPRNIK